MDFNVQIINNTTPALSVTTGTSTVTYEQIRNSLGQQNYNIAYIYLYSDNTNQLIGVYNYNRYDVSGNAEVTNIATVLDPNQIVGSLIISVKEKTNTDIVFNGNSSLSTTILPLTTIQLKFTANKITIGSIGGILSNIDNNKDSTFFGDCGNLVTPGTAIKPATLPIGDISAVDSAIATNSVPVPVPNTSVAPTTTPVPDSSSGAGDAPVKPISWDLWWLLFIVTGAYILTKTDK